MKWMVREEGLNAQNITTNGNKFMIGNGYIGYRGTLDEFSKKELTATTLAGLYDQVGDQWREPINAPNGLSTQIYCDGDPLHVLNSRIENHVQELDFSHAVHRRETTFASSNSNRVTFSSERFVSMDQLHLIANKMSIHCTEDCHLVIESGINGDVWDINGPHLDSIDTRMQDNTLVLNAITHELKVKVSIAESIHCDCGEQKIVSKDLGIYRVIEIDAIAGQTYEWIKYESIFTSMDDVECSETSAILSSQNAVIEGYDSLLKLHDMKWAEKWAYSDVEIDGDDEAQFALRYSIYQLLIIAPTSSEKVSIPARGLSGQVYKGAVFWDTEMFMLPFFLHTQPDVARNIMMYRCHTLDGARRKAKEYGFEGAFYAWESQDSGDDACTLFNVTDVFTGRPMRTYFRDKQIHISADAVHGIWKYYQYTGDDSILLQGGAEAIWECAHFFYSYAYYNSMKERFELIDVTGPDEYHERVNNNAFTNYMVKHSLGIALQTLKLLQNQHAEFYKIFMDKFLSKPSVKDIQNMYDSLYIPQPDEDTGIIEQFDRYFQLEDVSLADVKSRVINKNEYWGGGSGIATTTQIIKQADIVLMMHLFKEDFSQEIKQANWEYYEPRTEHGSSLSPCVYALVASDIGSPDWAYPYFLRTATIDLTGDSKQYVGDLYIGGTHPAANGGAWMAVVLGFAGVHYDGEYVHIRPALPTHWNSLKFSTIIRGEAFHITIGQHQVTISSQNNHGFEQIFLINDQQISCQSGQEVMYRYSDDGGNH